MNTSGNTVLITGGSAGIGYNMNPFSSRFDMDHYCVNKKHHD